MSWRHTGDALVVGDIIGLEHERRRRLDFGSSSNPRARFERDDARRLAIVTGERGNERTNERTERDNGEKTNRIKAGTWR